jgi:RNA-directed DNA polymerase
MQRIQFSHSYNEIISLENLLGAWEEFLSGKKSRADVQVFQRNLFYNLQALHHDLATGTYSHAQYTAFSISDPKPRRIHKATVRDRILHRAIYRQLYPFFDRTFIADSFSCRDGKGTHRAMDRFQVYAGKVSKNYIKPCWILKCDVKKFFASIDHEKLLEILERYIPDKQIMLLLQKIVTSFESERGKGLPLGSLTSQLFCNVYMNELDQFVKHKLKAPYYVRYADDFVFLSESKPWLEQFLPKASDFLESTLKLHLHPQKVYIKTFGSGVDFLGWVHFPTHRVLRTSTKNRMVKRVAQNPTNATIQSYLGMLGHGNGYKIASKIQRTIE